ncbi:MAG: A/G-specific adenine glycosylase [Rhodocyclaceae bacterium]|nr:A/G-specific adenine glycosylase [Rhodocyclaceae bacterium]
MPDFADRLIAWQARHGRHDLPWQQSRDPYRVWLSEVMLQQTQVDTVIPFYARFLERFPDVRALAAARLDEVLGLWSGLGYYARARNLHACARQVVDNQAGEFPGSVEALAQLPGIGRSTAAAIATFCFGARAAILDGNVRRILCRHFGIEGHPGQAAVQERLWLLAEAELPARDADRYIQAQMDLGATLCTRSRPACTRCPVSKTCAALATGRCATLPEARPRKAKPTRHQHVAILRRGHEVLLEPRPPEGLWGGLLTLPEVASPAELGPWLARDHGLAVERWRALEPVRHAFTHFTLEMQPLLVEVRSAEGSASGTRLASIALDRLDGVPLPAPVRRLLASPEVQFPG